MSVELAGSMYTISNFVAPIATLWLKARCAVFFSRIEFASFVVIIVIDNNCCDHDIWRSIFNHGYMWRERFR